MAVVVFALTGEARGLWVKTMTKPDKVEQTHGDEIFYYQNDDVEIMMNWNQRSIMIIPLVAHDWVFLDEWKKRNIYAKFVYKWEALMKKRKTPRTEAVFRRPGSRCRCVKFETTVDLYGTEW